MAAGPRLNGLTVIVTGANTGIGKETALDMAARGARVILACRDETKARAAAADITTRTGNVNVVVGVVDLASFNSIRTFTRNIIATQHRLDILINNAAIALCPRWKTKDNFEMQFGVNHLGHFLLTTELLELLKSSAPSRIVNVSCGYLGDSAVNVKIDFDDLNLDNSYTPLKAYAHSKLANILFTRELHHRLYGSGVTSYCVNPGLVKTDIERHFTPNLGCFKRCIFSCVVNTCYDSPAVGALTCTYCAVAAKIEKDSGKFFNECEVAPLPFTQAADDVVAYRLWEISEELVKPIVPI